MGVQIAGLSDAANKENSDDRGKLAAQGAERGPMYPSVQPPANSLESELFLEQNYCSVTSQTAGSPPATLINNQ